MVTPTNMRIGADNSIPVFWTGGWDSTFRVLDLLIRLGCSVQPIYVINPDRRSSEHELRTIKDITTAYRSQFPASAGKLKTLIVLRREKLPHSEEFAAFFAKLRTVFAVGPQYEWLASVNQFLGLEHIELSYAADDSKSVIDFVQSHSSKMEYECGASTNVLKKWEPANDYEYGMQLFLGFSFPLAFTTTSEMERVADEYGFAGLLTNTWSCHRPFFNQPCGVCNYCHKAIKTGKTAHFPKSALWRNKYRPIVNPILVFWNDPRDGLTRVANRILKRQPVRPRP